MAMADRRKSRVALKAQDGTIGRANTHLLEAANGSNNFATH
jgi:hypothetical protein